MSYAWSSYELLSYLVELYTNHSSTSYGSQTSMYSCLLDLLCIHPQTLKVQSVAIKQTCLPVGLLI